MKKLFVGLLVMGAVLGLASSALASPAQISEEDVTGETFVCSTTTYTIVSGSIKLAFHSDVTASGNANITGTISPQHVVARDEAGNVYSIRGAAWFGGAFNANTGGETFTDTEKFQIVQRGGGTVDSVNITAHMSPNGDFRFFDFGTCVPPEDEE